MNEKLYISPSLFYIKNKLHFESNDKAIKINSSNWHKYLEEYGWEKLPHGWKIRLKENASNFKYHKEIIGETNASLEFTLTIEDTDINGIDLITWNEAGLITEFKVFIRPLQGVNIIHKMMGNMLESFKNVS